MLAGSGRDMVVVEPSDVVATGSTFGGRLAVNLRRDRWLLDSRSATVTGLEDVTLVAPAVRILGDDGDNSFGSSACFAKLDGSGGEGRDSADGGSGRDRCRAERRRGCER